MKKLILALAAVLLIHFSVPAQEIIKPMPPGFDIQRDSIAHGNLDTLIYASKTVNQSSFSKYPVAGPSAALDGLF